MPNTKGTARVFSRALTAHRSISLSSNRSRISQLRKIEQSDLQPYDPEHEVENVISSYERRTKVTYWSLFRYATLLDKILMTFATIFAFVSAICLPWKMAVIGELMHFVLMDVKCDSHDNPYPSKTTVETIKVVFTHSYWIFIVESVFWYISFRFLTISANQQITVMRLTFFSKLLTKDLSWFDYFVNRPYLREKTEIMTRIRNGIGETIGRCVYRISACLSLLVLCLYIDYKLTLMLVIAIPFGILASAFGADADKKHDESINSSRLMADLFAEDALSNVKTVKIFQAEMKLVKRYIFLLGMSKLEGIRWLALASFCLGALYLSSHSSYWIVFRWGPTVTQFNLCETYKNATYFANSDFFGLHQETFKGPAKLFMVFLSTMYISANVMDIPKYIVAMIAAKEQASELYFTMDVQPRINNPNQGAYTPKNALIGRVEIINVSFRYVRSPSHYALRGVTMTMYPGQIIAIVGESGCGKTTVLKLIDRFHDPCEGQVMVDGNHSEALDVNWLRKHIGFVMQDPILFNGTVEDNFRCIKPGVKLNDIIEACKATEIHECILDLPKGYSTVITGEGNVFTEKQRRLICLARVLIQRPRLLLLDDPQPHKSDPIYDSLLLKIVDKVREQGTVIFTSTKCTTMVKKADFIFVMKGGMVVESGIHQKLLGQLGAYHHLLEGSLDIASEVNQKFQSQLAAYRYSTKLERLYDRKEADKQLMRQHDPSLSSGRAHLDDKPFLNRARRGLRDKRDNHDNSYFAYGFIGFHKKISFNPTFTEKQKVINQAPIESFGSIITIDNSLLKKKKKQYDSLKTLTVLNEKSLKSHNSSFTSLRQETGSIQSGDSAMFWDNYLERMDSWYRRTTNTSCWKGLQYLSLIFTKSVWPYALLGILASIILGFVIPCRGYLLGSVYVAVTEEKEHEREKKFHEAALYYLYVGLVSAFAGFLQVFAFGMAGRKLSTALQIKLFNQMLLQDLVWYDKPENDIHTLCDALTSDTHLVQKSVMLYYGLLAQSLTSIIVSIIWAVTLNVKFQLAALVLFALCPLYFVVALINRRQDLGVNRVALARATDLASEVVNKIQVVASLNLEEHFIEEYRRLLTMKSWYDYIIDVWGWMLSTTSTSLPFLVYGIFMYLAAPGNLNTDVTNLNFQDMIRISELLIMGMVATFHQLVILPDSEMATTASNKIKSIISSKPFIVEKESGVCTYYTTPPMVKFIDVVFQYPTGTDVPILRGICMEFVPETFVAIVGNEGCGKSSMAAVFARLYDPISGTIMFGNENSVHMCLSALRKVVKIVDNRELGLLNMTIEETIAFGDSNRTVSMEEIQTAAMETQTHHIIKRLKHGYRTKIRSLENTPENHALKQRIVLARAIIADPKILILNGFTTALDYNNTTLMQRAINNAREGRTLVVLSERIEPIRNADVIVVMNSGIIVEAGEDTELVEKKGLYYNLLMTQRLAESSEDHKVTFADMAGSTMNLIKRNVSLANPRKNSWVYSKFISSTKIASDNHSTNSGKSDVSKDNSVETN